MEFSYEFMNIDDTRWHISSSYISFSIWDPLPFSYTLRMIRLWYNRSLHMRWFGGPWNFEIINENHLSSSRTIGFVFMALVREYRKERRREKTRLRFFAKGGKKCRHISHLLLAKVVRVFASDLMFVNFFFINHVSVVK